MNLRVAGVARRLVWAALLVFVGCRDTSDPGSVVSSTHDSPVDGGAAQSRSPAAAPSAAPPAAPPAPSTDLIDVSGDDCTASSLVYTHPPGDTTAAGIPFVNDGCFGDRIFLGVDGVRRELTRRDSVPLGEGGPYADGELRAEVTRGKLLRRTVDYRPPDADCSGEGETEFSAVYEAKVRVWSPRGERSFSGTLQRTECAR
jgi:hypothetical protein